MRYSSFILKVMVLLFAISSCNTGEHSYLYKVSNESSKTIFLSYKVLNDTAKKDSLRPGESIVLAEREDVPGKDVWDIETSKSLYKIKMINAISPDSSRKTEELCYRKYWQGPFSKESNGEYVLQINDSLLSLSLQEDYAYYIKSEMEDTLLITSYLVSKNRKTDTIIGNGTVCIGKTNIYTLGEESKEIPKYKTYKIEGIHSITLWYKSAYKNMNLTKDTAFFDTYKDSCVLNVSDILFKNKK